MSNSIDVSIQSFLSNPDYKCITIPIFQRPYSWGAAQLSQFISDIGEALKQDDPRHFFGLIVFVSNDSNKKEIDLIDGQQRLTTIFISLSIIRDLMEDLKINYNWTEDELEDFNTEKVYINNIIYSNLLSKELRFRSNNSIQFENEFLEIIQKQILDYDMNEEPRKTYEFQVIPNKNRYLAKEKFFHEGRDKRKTKFKHSYKNYINIHNNIIEILDKKTTNQEKKEFLFQYSRVIREGLRIIPFHVDSYDRAFEYFEVLNDRGLDVSALDLIKNRFLQNVNNHSDREKIFNAWNNVFASPDKALDHTYNLLLFIRYAYMSSNGHITNNSVYSKYRDMTLNWRKSQILQYLSSDLLYMAMAFKLIKSPDTNLNSELHNAVELLKSTKTIQWMSIGMALLKPICAQKKITTNVKSKIILVLHELHEIMFALNFTDKVANELEKKLPEIAQLIIYDDPHQFETVLSKAKTELIDLKYKLKLSFKNIDFSNCDDWVNVFRKNNDLGHMFMFYFKYKDTSSSDKIYCTSLEHTLPQSLTEDNWPCVSSLNTEERERFIFSLGNFFITSPSNNASFGNKKWSEKKLGYLADNMFDILSDSDYCYKEVDTWDLEVIQKREELIIDKFVNL